VRFEQFILLLVADRASSRLMPPNLLLAQCRLYPARRAAHTYGSMTALGTCPLQASSQVRLPPCSFTWLQTSALSSSGLLTGRFGQVAGWKQGSLIDCFVDGRNGLFAWMDGWMALLRLQVGENPELTPRLLELVQRFAIGRRGTESRDVKEQSTAS